MTGGETKEALVVRSAHEHWKNPAHRLKDAVHRGCEGRHTQGRASYTMHFLRYEQLPTHIEEEVIARVQGRPVEK